MKQEIQKGVGSVKTIFLDIDSPLPMKNCELNFEQLALLAGKNGSGKTFILVNIWIINTLSQIVISKEHTYDSLVKYAQFLFDNSFTDQNINGKLGLEFTSGAILNIDLDKGKVLGLSINNFEDLNISVPSIFMSSGMRTFDNIKTYLNTRKIFKSPGNLSSDGREDLYIKLCNIYKIYDIIYIESLIMKTPIILSKLKQDSLKDFDFKDTITQFCFDEEKSDFYTTNNGNNLKYLTTYSKGEQSILNMLIANS